MGHGGAGVGLVVRTDPCRARVGRVVRGGVARLGGVRVRGRGHPGVVHGDVGAGADAARARGQRLRPGLQRAAARQQLLRPDGAGVGDGDVGVRADGGGVSRGGAAVRPLSGRVRVDAGGRVGVERQVVEGARARGAGSHSLSPSGWLFKKGAEDFAGGTVVHANAGAAALALVLVLGKRKGWPKERMRPHNVPFILLGAGLLWFGWFGFNAGSALGANTLSAYAFVNTNTATGAALVAWMLTEKIRDGHATTFGAASGAVAGLVAITPACGFVSPMGSIAIGLAAGVVCCLAVGLKNVFKFDDALDVVGVHLVGGILGALLIGFFGTKMVNGANGLFYKGGWTLMGHQALAVVAVVAYSFIVTYILAQILDKTIGMRISEEDEVAGLDLSQHGETAYESANLSDGSRFLSNFTSNK